MRTLEEIQSELRDLAPPWLFPDNDIGDALVEATAKCLQEGERKFEQYLDLVQRQTSEGAFLTDLGEDRGADRHPWEDDEEFRGRAILEPRGPAPELIIRDLGRMFRDEGYDCEYFEPQWRVTASESAIDSDPDACIYTSEDKGFAAYLNNHEYPKQFWIQVPVPEIEPYETGCFPDRLDTDVYVDNNCFLRARPRDESRRVFSDIDRYLEIYGPHGSPVAYRIVDTYERAHHSILYDQTGAVL